MSSKSTAVGKHPSRAELVLPPAKAAVILRHPAGTRALISINLSSCGFHEPCSLLRAVTVFLIPRPMERTGL